jgi:putative sterol carrier protein
MDTSTIEKYVQAMAQGLQSNKAAGLKIIYRLQLMGEGGGTWTVSIADGRCSVSQGAPPRADTTITMSTDDYLRLAAGKLNAVDAYNQGQIKVGGNLEYARKFVELFPPWASRVPPPPPSPPSSPGPTPAEPTLADYVRAMPQGFRPDKAGGLQATYQFQLTGAGASNWIVTVAHQACPVAEGETASSSATIRTYTWLPESPIFLAPGPGLSKLRRRQHPFRHPNPNQRRHLLPSHLPNRRRLFQSLCHLRPG